VGYWKKVMVPIEISGGWMGCLEGVAFVVFSPAKGLH
jgi:hypothetical protein